jgi:F-type H+-transporting ATPase subunit a
VTERIKNMRTRNQVFLGLGVMVLLGVILGLLFGSAGRNPSFQPQNEFKLDPWITIKIGSLDLSITKAVLYVVIAATLTTVTMTYIAKRMDDKPNRVQTAVEAAYDLTYNQITRNNMDTRMALKWFPFLGTLFLFIWFSNLSATSRCRRAPSTP